MSNKHQEINPNAAIDGLKSMLQNLSGLQERFGEISTTIDQYTIKDKKVFILNGKEGEIAITKNNFITISLPDANESDVKEITRKLLSQ